MIESNVRKTIELKMATQMEYRQYVKMFGNMRLTENARKHYEGLNNAKRQT